MDKMKFNSDNSVVDAFIKEVQSRIAEEVTINNVNDFKTMLDERDNCSNCTGLKHCKNSIEGSKTEYVNGKFVVTDCKYKEEAIANSLKQSLIKTLYLPRRIVNADLADFELTSDSRKELYKDFGNFIVDYKSGKSPKGLYLYGGFSKGKTYALACLANELAKNNIECLLIYVPDMLIDLKNSFGSSRYEEVINMLRSVEVLMLDDIGSENMTSWVRDDVLGPILNYRMLEEKPVFMTSNIGPLELKAHLLFDKDELKARRVFQRIQALVTSVNMDDSKTYDRN